MDKARRMLILALMVDAAAVFVGVSMNRNMWAFIVVYWAILTVKNTLDVLERDEHSRR